MADNFGGLTDPITKCTFYGAAAYYSGGWFLGVPAPIEPFHVKFYQYQQEWTQPPATDPGIMAPTTGWYTINLWDTYGDGWNGGMLDVYVDGTLVLNDLTLAGGYGPETQQFYANAGEYILTVYTPGGWPSENWYEILDPDDIVIATDGYGGTVPTGIGVLPPLPLLAPATGTYTVELYDTWGDGWNGGLLDVYVNNSQVLNDCTVASGFGPATYYFDANVGDEIATVYTPGSWPDENWYQILDPSAAVIAVDGAGSSIPTGIGFVSTLVTLEPNWASPLYSFDNVPVLTSYVGPAWGGWEVYQFDAYLPGPVPLAEGWVSAQINSPLGSGEWFLWWTSLNGDGLSYQRVGAKSGQGLSQVQPLSSRNGTRDQLIDDMAIGLATGVPEQIVVSEYPGTPLPPGVTVVDGGTIPPELLGPDTGEPAVLYTIDAVGIWDVVVFRPVAWTVDWYCWIKVGGVLISGPNPIPLAQVYHIFTAVDFGSKGEATVIINDNQTLPVELSSFTATLTADLFVNIAWVAQSETNHLGYNVLRGENDTLAEALQLNAVVITEGEQLGTQMSYNYLDTEVQTGTTYHYWLESLDLGGGSQFFGPISVQVTGEPGDPGIPPLPPTVTKLLPAYPNPFNPSTNIRYQLVEPATVRIEIYNVKGQLIRSYENSYSDPGYYQIMWDGRDAQGKPATSGVYLYRMTAGKYSSYKKMVLAK